MPNAFTQDAGELTRAPLDAAAAALLEAADEGDAASVAALLASGADADARTAPGGDTPLMRASARGHLEIARALLDSGADASAQRADGFTPLLLAVFYGHEMVARLLVERGADPTAHTKLGMTATRWAAARGFEGMARMLREAEATRPDAQVVQDNAPAVGVGVQTVRAEPGAVRTKAAAPSSRASSSDDAGIFARRSLRADAPVASAAGAAADASSSSVEAYSSSSVKVSTSGLSPLGLSQSNVASTNPAQADAPAANVSVRGGGRVPAHPSASVFRVGHFLRSWQGSVGVALLLLAFGVAVFALMRGGKSAGLVAPPKPTPTAPQAAAQPPAQALPAPQPSPTLLPAELGQPVAPVTDPAYVPPNTMSPPYYGPPLGPAHSDAPRELMVVSEGGTPAAEEAGRTKRKPDANANNAAPAATPEGRRGEPSATQDARNTRPAEAEQRPAQPPPSQPPPPATQPTPRGKVIQWPPQ